MTAFGAGAVRADDVQYAKAVSNHLNTTGRTIDLELPLESGEQEMGDVPVRINPDDSILINRQGLLNVLTPILDQKGKSTLLQMATSGTFVTPKDLLAAGFDVRFDSALQLLRFVARRDQLPSTDLSLAGHRSQQVSAALAIPAYAAGYVNIYASIDHQWDSGGASPSSPETGGRLQMDSAIRIGRVVFENSGVLAGAVDVNVCPTIAICTYAHTPGFKRQISRLVYDMPEDRIRSELGDVEPLGMGFQRTPQLLGFSIEKSARKLTPGDPLTPTGSGSFVIDRPSRVEIRVNGAVQQRLDLRPGAYNIRDLPLSTGANNIDIVITDDTGEKHTVSYTSFFDTNLLSAGNSEWAVTGGAPSYLRDEQRDYLPDLYMAGGFYRYGVTDDLTAETDVQANRHIAMVGAGMLVDTGFGLINARAAGSGGDRGVGGALGLDWSLVNFKGLTGEMGESFRLYGEYRTPAFLSPGDIDTTSDTGIIVPEWNDWLNLNASWSGLIGHNTTMTVSARYEFINADDLDHSQLVWTSDRYGADVTLSRPLTDALSGSLTLGVSNESFLAALEPSRERAPEFRVGFRLFGRPDAHTTVTAGYDSLDKQTDLSAYRSVGDGVGRWDTNVFVQNSDFEDQASVNASAAYYGNRAEVRVIQNSGFDGISYSDFNIKAGPQRTSLQLGTAIAFADGHVTIGAPVTGDAFAIVYPHASIADKDIIVGPSDSPKAIADHWGPALVPSLPAYSPSTIPVDADDLPIGYSLGSASFDTFAPFKSGYALEVGSAYSVSAYGTILSADGKPMSLVSGTVTLVDHPEKSVTIFTNAAGRFGADGLAPGRWLIDMDTDDAPARYVLNIPPGADGLFKAGTLYPEVQR